MRERSILRATSSTCRFATLSQEQLRSGTARSSERRWASPSFTTTPNSSTRTARPSRARCVRLRWAPPWPDAAGCRMPRARRSAVRLCTVLAPRACLLCHRRPGNVSEPSAPRPLAPVELRFEQIVYEKAPPRATITLNRPEVLNAFNFRMLRELARAAEAASWDDEIRVVVLTGAGRAFCVGADLKEWSEDYLGRPEEYWKWFGAFEEAHDRLRGIGKPTLARINGICVGGGNELQMTCDLAVMVEDAYIRHVGLEHGSVPAGGATQWLP